jgi:cell division protease FtsH
MEPNNKMPNGNNNNNKMNMPKFNLNWMYFIILAVLAGLYFANDSSTVKQRSRLWSVSILCR